MIYGYYECIVGLILGTVSLVSNISSLLNKASFLKSFEIIFLFISFLASLRLIISGLENIKKGLDEVEANNIGWKDKYLA